MKRRVFQAIAFVSVYWFHIIVTALTIMLISLLVIGFTQSHASERVVTSSVVTSHWHNQGERVQVSEDTEKIFSDVPENAWYYSYVYYCVEQGLLEGYPDGTFHPEGVMTRGQIAAIIHRMMGDSIDTSKYQYDIRDIDPSDWYYDDIKAVVGAFGIVSSQGLNSRFNSDAGEYHMYYPDVPASRMFFAKLLGFVRVAKSLYGPYDSTDNLPEFTDLGGFSDTMVNIVRKLAAAGVFTGTGDGRFEPDGAITRAQVAAALCRFRTVFGK